MFQSRHEYTRLGQLFPDLRQESAARIAGDENDTIDIRAQLSQRIRFIGKLHGRWLGEQRDFDFDTLKFCRRDGAETWIAKRGTGGIGAHILTQRPMGFERTYAATQLTVEGQSDKGRAKVGKFRMAGAGRYRTKIRAEMCGNRIACVGEQYRA